MLSDKDRVILRAYDQQILIPEVGIGSLRARLLGGLEQVLDRGESEHTMPMITTLYLNREIDYEALGSVRYGEHHKWSPSINLLGRIRNVFIREGINTYGKLYLQYRDWLGGSVPNKDSPKKFLKHYSGLGDESVKLLITHLESIGFPFGTVASIKESEENK